MNQNLEPALPEGLTEMEHVSLCETLDRVLNKGVVVVGEVFISVAGIDLIYLGLNLVLTSIETARTAGIARQD
jgi:Gas vesicle protein